MYEMYTVYILYSLGLAKYYIGYTSGSAAQRLCEHLGNHSGFTGKAKDWKIVYTEIYASKAEAMKRERTIKQWKSKKMIERLVSSTE
jgi:putative endonuclease